MHTGQGARIASIQLEVRKSTKTLQLVSEEFVCMQKALAKGSKDIAESVNTSPTKSPSKKRKLAVRVYVLLLYAVFYFVGKQNNPCSVNTCVLANTILLTFSLYLYFHAGHVSPCWKIQQTSTSYIYRRPPYWSEGGGCVHYRHVSSRW